MNKKTQQKNKGFTIVEAIVAIFILSISISAMLGLTVSSYSTAKYANNEITASYLLQEAIDSIRNSRDTLAFQMKNDSNKGWAGFLTRYNSCFNPYGCIINNAIFRAENTTPTNFFHINEEVIACNGETATFGDIKCSPLSYASGTNDFGTAFYKIGGVDSNFKRQVKMVQKGLNEVEITATVEYRNGTSFKTRTLKMNLMNWKAD